MEILLRCGGISLRRRPSRLWVEQLGMKRRANPRGMRFDAERRTASHFFCCISKFLQYLDFSKIVALCGIYLTKFHLDIVEIGP